MFRDIFIYMKYLEPDNLFKHFTGLPEDGISIEDVETLEEDRLLIVVVKSVESFYLIDSLKEKKYGDKYVKIRSKVKAKYFDIIFEMLEQISLEHIGLIQESVQEIGAKLTVDSLEDMLFDFQEREEYEKCQIVKNLLDKCKLFC